MKERFKVAPATHLESFLSAYNIPAHTWGQGNAKTAEHLYREIKRKDSQLIQENGELIRKLKFIEVNVEVEAMGKKLRLVEDRQVFNEGKSNQRTRRRPEFKCAVKEKIHLHEDPDQAVVRAIKEEIGRLWSDHDLKLINPQKVDQKIIRRESMSYPGLLTHYDGHSYHLQLPRPLFSPDGYKEIQPDKTTYFVWKEI